MLIRFSGVAAGEACTIVLRGSSNSLLDEAERSLHDALCVLTQTVQNPLTTLGGGCAEMLMSKAVDELAAKTPGKKAIAMESFARALRALPTILAENAGYDASELVAQLRVDLSFFHIYSFHFIYNLSFYSLLFQSSNCCLLFPFFHTLIPPTCNYSFTSRLLITMVRVMQD